VGISNLAHVYPQRRWHDDACIVGDEAALRGLLKAIEQALARGEGLCETFAADGEGYRLVVIRLRDPGLWDLLRLPYADDRAVDGRKEAIGPRELMVKLRRWPGAWRSRG